MKTRNRDTGKGKTAKKTRMSRLKKGLLVVAGCLSLLLGLVGIPVPMLPTTPFLLLSAYLFARSSPRIYHWLLHHRYLGKFIRDYHEKKGVPLKVKTWALTLLWATILYSALWMIETLWIKLLLIAIATGVSVHILSLRTIK